MERSDGSLARPVRFPDAKILFLDGNNTMLRLPDGAPPYGFEALQNALRRPLLAEVLIVACGDWKTVLSLDEIRSNFDDNVAARIVDRTPDLEEDDSGFLIHREIYEWLDAHSEIAQESFLGPFYGREPHLENGVFISDGLVFGEDPKHVPYLEEVFAPPDPRSA